MDVTFTNVLEGARQYFQGLPAATGATASPSYEPSPSAPEQHQQQQQHTVPSSSSSSATSQSYWPSAHQDVQQQQRAQERTESSHQQVHHAQQHQQQLHQQEQNHSNHRTQGGYQIASSSYGSSDQQQQQQQYHFSRPQSRDAPSNVMQQHHHPQQQQQYQSHIMPNPSYHQPASPHQQQLRVPSRQPAATPPSSSQQSQSQSYYHQLQPSSSSQSQNVSSYHSNYQQQSHSSYYHHPAVQQSYVPVSSSQSYVPSSNTQSYVPSSSSQSYNNNKTISNQSSSTASTDNMYYQKLYATTGPVASNKPSVSTLTTQQEQQQQMYTSSTNHEGLGQEQNRIQQNLRTTHNLPPIAALSSYHSNRSSSKDNLRQSLSSKTARAQINSAGGSSSLASTTTSTSSAGNIGYSASGQYASDNSRLQAHYGTAETNHQDYSRSIQQYQQQNKVLPVSQYHHASSSQSYNPIPVSTPSQMYPSAVNAQQNQPSSNQQYYQYSNSSKSVEVHQQQQSTNYPTVQQSAANQNNVQQQQAVEQNLNRSTNSVKQKRESPLDLSVKTVRTSADSTLDDTDASDLHRNSKYSTVNRANQQPVPSQQGYHSSYNNVYANNVHRSNIMGQQRVQQLQGSGAPKVDFLPNFNMPNLNQTSVNNSNRRPVVQYSYDKGNVSRQQSNVYPTNKNNNRSLNNTQSASTSYTNSSYSSSQLTMKSNPQEGLPRIDFPPRGNSQQKSSVMYPVPPQDNQRKRTADPAPPIMPSKVPKVDSWRQSIDQQIEQRLSSYAKKFHTQPQNAANKPMVNGNYAVLPQKDSSYPTNAYTKSYTLPNHTYTNTSQYHQQPNHSQTYVPSASVHPFPGYAYPHQTVYPHHTTMSRTNSSPSLPTTASRANTGADKRVLSLLRNSLEIKGAKEAQKKIEQDQFRSSYEQHPRTSDIQQPSTDVTAPLQPKTGMMGRHNVSPFTASNLLERNSNTPPTYKFHIPKAIDSVRFESDSTKMPEKHVINNFSQNNTDLDGLAAFLAARIRTKAELKQVGPGQNISNNNMANLQAMDANQKSPVRVGNEVLPNSTPSSGGSPPKLVKEKQAYPPRRRLFSKTEEEPGSLVPPRDKSGLRSSSETSIFDFPDTDSEGEMPVLERQSLEDMRRDRKFSTKQSTTPIPKAESPIRTPSPFDDVFEQACNIFMEQLKQGNGKKRGRRKKGVEPEVLAMLEETVTKEKPLEADVSIKEEKCDDTVEVRSEIEEIPKEQQNIAVKVENDSDSDVPLSKCKKDLQVQASEKEVVKKCDKPRVRRRIVSSSDSSSDSEPEHDKDTKPSLVEEEKLPKIDFPLNPIGKPPKKPAFGDGSAFHAGWEEEVYKYKKSLRMPASLIQLTRPPACQRLSSSLPDLDPCPQSPTPSSVTDNMEYSSSKQKIKVKSEIIDSDIDSNSSFSFSFSNKNYDSEGSSSVKSFNTSLKDNNNSIIDKLLERCGPRKRRKNKKKDEQNGPKIIPKAENPVELLPTPSLEVKTETKAETKSQGVVKLDSVLLGFRKKTVNNFKDAFLNNSNKIVGINEQFTTVVLKSRTRTETRVLKQRATIKEVFGEDRPASAPPTTCMEDIKVEADDNKDSTRENVIQQLKDTVNGDSLKVDQKSPVRASAKQALKDKLLSRGKKRNNSLLKVLVDKKIKTELPEKDDCAGVIDNKQRDVDAKSETPSLDGDDSMPQGIKKKIKLRNIRRKFSSGFDYIRKKKKQIKKEVSENAEPHIKPVKRRELKAMPESEQDIQREIKTWVLNKGIGETHLHRAARLGYTDITAYCLEKMGAHPSPKDNAGYTPLHEACSRGHLNIAKLLLRYGANVSESAQGGIRPLHEAVENGFIEIVRLLLSYGADPLLATYSGLTPMSLAVDEATAELLREHLADVQGMPSKPWTFLGPASCFDPPETGYDPLEEAPEGDPKAEEEDIELEISDTPLPNLYTLRGEAKSDRWVLLQDLSSILRIKSRDALLKQISPPGSSPISYKNVLRELKMSDFLEQAHCCQFLNGSEKVNVRASKIALVKYTDKVKQLLNIEKCLITAR